MPAYSRNSTVEVVAVSRPACAWAYQAIANAAKLDTLIVGTGSEVWIPPSWLRDRLRKVSVVIDAMQTGPAIRTYNIMIGERRRVAAALIAVP